MEDHLDSQATAGAEYHPIDHIPDDMRNFLEKYSGIAPDRILSRV